MKSAVMQSKKKGKKSRVESHYGKFDAIACISNHLPDSGTATRQGYWRYGDFTSTIRLGRQQQPGLH
jgi:hypothetical protein